MAVSRLHPIRDELLPLQEDQREFHIPPSPPQAPRFS